MNLLDSSEMAYKNGYGKAVSDIISLIDEEIDLTQQAKQREPYCALRQVYNSKLVSLKELSDSIKIKFGEHKE